MDVKCNVAALDEGAVSNFLLLLKFCSLSKLKLKCTLLLSGGTEAVPG